MSSLLVGLALHSKCGTPARKVLLLSLCERASDEGKTVPTALSYLGKMAEIKSKTTVLKYRRELSTLPIEDDQKGEVRLGLITWKGSKGFDGACVYTIDVEKLREMSMHAVMNGQNMTISRSNNDHSPSDKKAVKNGVMVNNCTSNGQLLNTVLTNKLTTNKLSPLPINEFGQVDTYKINFITTEREQDHGPNWITDPVITMFCETFRVAPTVMQVYSRLELCRLVELNEDSLRLWHETLTDYVSMPKWYPYAFKNLTNRYLTKRYDKERTILQPGPGNGSAEDVRRSNRPDAKHTRASTGKNEKGTVRTHPGRSAEDTKKALGY